MKHIIATLLISCVLVLPSFAQELIAHYPMDGNTKDITPNRNHGAVIGATLCPDRFGKPNQAYRFTQTSDKIRVASAKTLDLNRFATFSVSLWFRRTKFDHNGYNPILVMLGQNTLNYALMVDPEFAYGSHTPQYKNQLLFTNYSARSDYQLVINNMEVGDSLWHHLVYMVRQDKGIVEGYLDGTPLGQRSFKHNPLADFTIIIGNHISNNWAFIGDIDDVCIYGKELTKKEISDLFGKPVKSEPPVPEHFGIFPKVCDKYTEIRPHTPQEIKAVITNMNGEKLQQQIIRGNTRIATDHLPNGTYIISFYIADKLHSTQKIIVSHSNRA